MDEPVFQKAIVLGAAGQVGAALVEALGNDRAVPVGRKQVAGGPAVELEDVLRNRLVFERVFDLQRPRIVFIAAGMSWVDGCEERPAEAMRLNCQIPAAIAEITADQGARTVYFSTEYVFDGESGPYREDDRPAPLSAYGWSKLRGEREVLANDPNALVVRTTVVYGPEQKGKNFAYQVADALLQKRVISVPEDQFSSPTYSRDLAAACVALVDASVKGVVHVVGREVMSRAELAFRIAETLHGDPRLIQPVLTASLHQPAPRPLKAGLRTERLATLLPQLRMHNVSEALFHWARNQYGKPWGVDTALNQIVLTQTKVQRY